VGVPANPALDLCHFEPTIWVRPRLGFLIQPLEHSRLCQKAHGTSPPCSLAKQNLEDKVILALPTFSPIRHFRFAALNSKPLTSDAPVSRLQAIMRRIPIAVVWALAGQGILSVTRLLTSMTVGGRFGPGSEGELGYYSNAFGALMILVGLHEAFVTTPLTVFNQKQHDEKNRKSFAGNMLISSFLVIGLIAVGTGLLIAIQSGFKVLKPELGAALIAAAALAPLQLLREFSRRWLLANLEVKQSAMLEGMFAILYLSVLAALVFAANVSAIVVFVAIGCVNVVGLAVWWYIYKDRFQFSKSTTATQVGDNFRYGRWVAGENVCATVTMFLCPWILTYVVDEKASGVFFACFTIVLLANPFLLGMSSILAPRAAQEYVANGWAGLNRILFQYGGFIFAVLFAFAAFLSYFGADLTERIFGPRYSDYFVQNLNGTNTITATLAWAMPCLGISFVAACGLLAANRPSESFFAAIVGLVVLVVANFSTPNPNLQTAAVSFVISVAAAMLIRIAFLVRASRSQAVSSNDSKVDVA